jgi:hypothetical protein
MRRVGFVIVFLWVAGLAAGQSTLAPSTNSQVPAYQQTATPCITSPRLSTSPVNITCDTAFFGANPHLDVRAYGVRSCNPSTPPCAPGITATLTSGTATASLSATWPGVNGDGVTVIGAGTAHSMPTPEAPTVTPSNASGPTGMGFVVNAPSGSTTYNYKIIAHTTSGGYTAASSPGTTTAGAATLGWNTVNITSQSRSGTVTKAATSSVPKFSAGTMVVIGGATDPTEFTGWQVASTVGSGRQFTYTNGIDASAPILSSTSTGGAAAWFDCNHLSWKAVSGAFNYYIYSDRANPGTYTLIGVSEPGTTTWDDFGSPMMDGISLPYYIPTTPPSTASNNNLSTTILGGAETAALTLATRASTSVSGATIVLDNAPTFAAAIAANANAATLYFPAGETYVFNSYMNTGTVNVSVGGQLWLNDTMYVQGRWYGNLTPTSGAPPQFSFEAENQIVVNEANPGFYSGAFNSSSLRGLQFTERFPQGRAVLMQGSIQGNYEWLNFSLPNNDYMGVGLELSSVFADSFFNTLNHVTAVGPQSLRTATPILAFTHKNGVTQLNNISLSGRCIHYDGDEFYLMGGRDQAGSCPVVMSTNWATLSLTNFDQDTMGTPLVTNLSPYGTSVTVTNAGTPSSGLPMFSGKPFGSISTAGFSYPSGQNINTVTPSTVANQAGFKIWGTSPLANSGQGSSATIGYAMFTPPTPSVATSGATGPAAGTYYYSVEAVDALGNATPPGAQTSITVNGRQGVLVTFPTPQSGQVAWNICRALTSPGNVVCAQGGGPSTGNNVSSSNATFLDNGIGPTNSPNSSAYAANSWLGSTGLGGQYLTLVGGGYTAKFSGTFTANQRITVPNASFTMGQSIFGGTITMTTAAISSGAYGSTVSVKASGVASSDTIEVTPNSQPSTTNISLRTICWPTPGNVNCAYFNPSASSVTPTAQTLNVSVRR